ncbi:hypothetical protein Q6348_08770 [Isoptericola sp. b441]|uniref:Secreted protein n=1 Tax=Actinotalea lenta TaxID=3064654 RepID=A0ABT9D8Q9_9CELL|nr:MULTISPECIES: hypothetical protein [unclassified Isoptericola]MDO8107284.1 hypothetical protein [Isoptericola sp. b441]MDO8121054.1 hypothetical protein [Isoptericola sp. b490]
MRIRRIVAVAVCAPLLTIAGAGAANAGEISGPPQDGFGTGGWTPVAGYVMQSICAFSGLNAYHPAGGGFPEKQPAFPTVQSYGMFVKAGLKDVVPAPGDACNGHTGEIASGG